MTRKLGQHYKKIHVSLISKRSEEEMGPWMETKNWKVGACWLLPWWMPYWILDSLAALLPLKFKCCVLCT